MWHPGLGREYRKVFYCVWVVGKGAQLQYCMLLCSNHENWKLQYVFIIYQLYRKKLLSWIPFHPFEKYIQWYLKESKIREQPLLGHSRQSVRSGSAGRTARPSQYKSHFMGHCPPSTLGRVACRASPQWYCELPGYCSLTFFWQTGVYRSVTLKKNYGTHVIKLDIAPKTYPLGQHLFIAVSNNMFYRHSQWNKRHNLCC